MSMEKQARLVEVLIRRTSEGDLDWQTAPVSGVFQLNLSGKGVRLRQSPSEQGPEILDVVIELINEDGEIADSFSDEDLGREWYRKMNGLYEDARRAALGTDKLLKETIDELDEIPF